MVTLTIAQVKEAVRASIDELQPNESYMAGVQDKDNEDLDTIIQSRLLEALCFVEMHCARELLSDAPVITPTVVSATGKVLHVSIPADMIRFVGFKATDSDYTVTTVIGEDSDEALKQNDEYTCGTYQRPAIVLKRGSGNTNTLNYYSLATVLGTGETAASRVDSLSYITNPAIVNNSVEVCSLAKNAFIAFLTGLVLEVFKEQNADSFISKAKTMMGI